ncbi:COMM domain-containing protein 10 isoform X4 [Balaenoptera acutorostrata]|uniref:COMM domain-containing protein 10 isoform X4 n=1 Tax=Balaenoptera acutorostrata TaxID=9767 RepID=A0ABM3T472_BALAC|nr:COMM domain-containing protein 10 isoform X4 [Balaenoptera acutorostrata]
MAASAALILRESPSMKKAVSLINEIDIGRFPRLLTRILQKLHLKAENSFSEEEEEKLQAAFSLERQDLHLVLETISFILEQLETVGWQLNLQMAHSAQAKLKSPQAVLQLGVSNEDSKSLKKVLVEFSHKELFDFYNKRPYKHSWIPLHDVLKDWFLYHTPATSLFCIEDKLPGCVF